MKKAEYRLYDPNSYLKIDTHPLRNVQKILRSILYLLIWKKKKKPTLYFTPKMNLYVFSQNPLRGKKSNTNKNHFSYTYGITLLIHLWISIISIEIFDFLIFISKEHNTFPELKTKENKVTLKYHIWPQCSSSALMVLSLTTSRWSLLILLITILGPSLVIFSLRMFI